MYRTDKQFMRNPATAASRVYIGSIARTTVTGDLENIFNKHGNITGMTLNANLGFAFVQYEHEHEAQTAIRNESGTMLNGRKIIVKRALDKSKPGNQGGGGGRGPPPKSAESPLQRSGDGPPQRGPPPGVQKPEVSPNRNNPPLQKTPPPELNLKNQSQEGEFQDENMEDDRPNIRPPPGPQFNDDGRGRKGGRKPGRGGPRGRSNERDRFDRFDGPRDGPRGGELRFEPPPDAYRDRDPYYGRDNYGPPPRVEPFAPPVLEPPPQVPEKNDCEIIVVSKGLTEYAEFIENKLKNLGLIVDLLFPNEDVPIGKVLANICSRGCLYAILVMPVNEEHRSLTLNILHGIPQEHRNMPVEDALILISRNFEAYMKGEHLPSENTGQLSLLDRHPTSMQLLINLLAENRQLTTVQYDQIIKYIEERKELQHEYEVAEGISPESQNTDPKQAELQNRILNILNKSSDTTIPTSITAPDPPASKNEAPILKDPTVQKALDSLILGDMFKNITGSA